MNHNKVVTTIRESPYKWVAALAASPFVIKGLEFLVADGQNPFVSIREFGETAGFGGILSGLGYLLVKEMKRTQIREVQKLEELAMKDHLTGMYNRRYLESAFEREIQREERRKEGTAAEVVVLFIDTDNFKQINETFGYGAGGDVVLKMIGEYLQKEARKTDIVGRLGGDEFLVICPNTSVESALTFAERLCEGVAKHEQIGIYFSSRRDVKHDLEKVTITIGVVGYKIPRYEESTYGETYATLYRMMKEQAERALKEAKEAGKNRVHDAGYLVMR